MNKPLSSAACVLLEGDRRTADIHTHILRQVMLHAIKKMEQERGIENTTGRTCDILSRVVGEGLPDTLICEQRLKQGSALHRKGTAKADLRGSMCEV